MVSTLGLSARPALYQVILRHVLADVPLFASLTAAQLSRVAAVSVSREVEADTVVAVRGEPARHLIVAETGGFTAVHETATGQRRRLGEFTAPCAVDKAAVLDGGGHTATWVATARSRLRLVPAAEFLALVDVPSVRAHVFAHLAGQLRTQQEDLVLTSFADATTRVAAWLVRAATPRVRLPGAQQGLAETLGLTRVSVNRALRTLASEGLVRVEPGVVVVLAPELLTLRVKSHLTPVRQSPPC
jgi:CRP/FNR family transcriptional regulator, cyclic AMP receptor protein